MAADQDCGRGDRGVRELIAGRDMSVGEGTTNRFERAWEGGGIIDWQGAVVPEAGEEEKGAGWVVLLGLGFGCLVGSEAGCCDHDGILRVVCVTLRSEGMFELGDETPGTGGRAFNPAGPLGVPGVDQDMLGVRGSCVGEGPFVVDI